MANERQKVNWDGPCLIAATIATVMGSEAIDPMELHPMREAESTSGTKVTAENVGKIGQLYVDAGKRRRG